CVRDGMTGTIIGAFDLW
nr:immunoglobulin heavy chain junction region [Macaca mulatta]MOV49111.1 immunoglobulin heavy chain junction region [Macaca mulatta]MOV49334.1 immunoglobulin heavy chain junction region [Macaca mulatta]MOV49401.1 immunoglobulin heavy chain junction region [Macaca mulatta]MOV49530.1 immunoglobulin heavy chain junction region [Macaca mulatta]